jgi:hypothetical protein
MTQDKEISGAGGAKTSRKRRAKDPARLIVDYFSKSNSPEETLFMINEVLFSSQHENTRKHVRAPISVPVSYKINNKTHVSSSYTLSQKGAFIKSPQPVAEGKKIEVELALPDGGDPVRVEGEVVQSLPFKEAREQANISGMSVVFHKMRQEDRRRIDKLVRAKAKKIKKRKK